MVVDGINNASALASAHRHSNGRRYKRCTRNSGYRLNKKRLSKISNTIILSGSMNSVVRQNVIFSISGYRCTYYYKLPSDDRCTTRSNRTSHHLSYSKRVTIAKIASHLASYFCLFSFITALITPPVMITIPEM
ncbi:hypothetical protein J2Z83_002755 [Virgibacillus natechei]|uniref:Uncharacterized protein n=1 Tax=Virgibacillus natechei TaxID=1216297 RepID=A0ABS4II45_9BACI|nr:hypothetical protein [Virgibacillus natechei]